MTPARPQLAPVLAHLTDTDVALWQVPGVVVRVDGKTATRGLPGKDGPYWMVAQRWTVASVAEAWEVLVARGVIPQGYAGWFVPAGGMLVGAYPDPGVPTVAPDPADQLQPHPASLPDLVAWCSLGMEAIATVEATAKDLAPNAAVLWRVGTRSFAPMDADGWSDAERAIWTQGIGVDRTASAVTLFVPPLAESP